MSYFDRRLGVHEEGAAKGPIRAKLFNRRLGQQDIVIDNVSVIEIGAVAISAAPHVGEQVKIRLPNEREIEGTVVWTRQKAFWVNLDGVEGQLD